MRAYVYRIDSGTLFCHSAEMRRPGYPKNMRGKLWGSYTEGLRTGMLQNEAIEEVMVGIT